jgi:hypothetical protein
MCFFNDEGLPDIEARAILMLDASGTMGQKERKTDEPKSQCVARMVQDLLNTLDNLQYAPVTITIACFSADKGEAKIIPLLEGYCPYDLKTYTGGPWEHWDGLNAQHRAQGMGHGTPIGTSLAWGRKHAEAWVRDARGQVQRRAVIYLLSDGMNNLGLDGMEEKQAIQDFNLTCEQGEIKLATIGYYQSKEGENQEEDAGRKLLSDLQLNKNTYFESDDVQKIARYILETVTQAIGQAP